MAIDRGKMENPWITTRIETTLRDLADETEKPEEALDYLMCYEWFCKEVLGFHPDGELGQDVHSRLMEILDGAVRLGYRVKTDLDGGIRLVPPKDNN